MKETCKACGSKIYKKNKFLCVMCGGEYFLQTEDDYYTRSIVLTIQGIKQKNTRYICSICRTLLNGFIMSKSGKYKKQH